MESGPLESLSAPANLNDNQPVILSAEITSEFVCHAPGCRLKSFKRRAELARHELKHAGTRNFSCPGWDCSKAFTRKDKLVDHIRAGHDADALFVCSKPGCEETFTKDVLPLHIQEFAYIQKYRKCPMPRCKFCIADVRSQSLDVMQAHLLEEHDALGRKKFAGVLALGGYHYEDVKILCPICPGANFFEDHRDFYAHFLIQHRPGATSPSHDTLGSLYRGYGNRAATHALREAQIIPDEVHEHCRTILSLWPDFEDHPVWDDVKRCSS